MNAQNLEDLEDHDVEQIYKKIDVDPGTLDEDGDEIDFIFVETEIDEGLYEIEITDGPGDLYEIMGTDLFLKFRFYFGYAGYGQECILKVEGGYSGMTLYEID